MNSDKDRIISEEYIKKLRDALCAKYIEAAGPGVYYVSAHDYGEGYLAEQDSSTISDTAKAYGKQIPELPGLLFYSLEDVHSGAKIVGYELEKYAVAHGLPEHDCGLLHSAAIYAAEYHPEYFGTYPAPRLTPWGYTVRYQAIDNGVYWLETDQCREGLAVCYPIWDSELSEEATHLGKLTDYDQENGVEETLGYLFFKREDACVPIFEMMETREEWATSGRFKIPELMNAIWLCHPEYVLGHNTREQLGQNDILSQLMAQLGVEIEPNISVENMISLHPEAGCDYLNL